MQSMQEHDTFPGKVYAVTCASGCTITDNKGRTLGECEAGKQTLVVATSDKLVTSADALVIATFNAAPALGSGSGGGVEIKFDTAPKSGSKNAVTSGGLYDILYSNSIRLARGGTAQGYSVAIGDGATTALGAIALGKDTYARGGDSIAIGAYSSTEKRNTSAFGKRMILKDTGCVLIGVWNEADSIATQLYLINAGSPMANTYEDGEACLGYIVKDVSGNIQACGTRKLSELLTNNTAFAPAALDLDAPAPTPFLPTGIMEPIEFPDDLTE